MELGKDFFAVGYLVATVLFIFGLKGLASPKTALKGNRSAMIGMLLAVVLTLFHPHVQSYTWIFAGLIIGALIGIPIALKIKMASMPQLVAALHSFVGLAAVLIAGGMFLLEQKKDILTSVSKWE